MSNKNTINEDHEDGLLLRDAINAFYNSRTEKHLFDLLRLLSKSDVWVPCNAVMSERDEENLLTIIREKGTDSKGWEFKSMDNIRLIPDILQNGDDYYFPVFSSEEEMGEYGDHFSKIPMSFLRAISLARNNEKNVKGIVINAFTKPFIVVKDIFGVVEKLNNLKEG